MAKVHVQLTPGDVALDKDGNAVISNTSLLNGLVKDQTGTLAGLQKFGHDTANDINIDSFGRVLVKNKQFATSVSNAVKAVAENVNGCGCEERDETVTKY